MRTIAVTGIAVLSVCIFGLQQNKSDLKVGDKAPEFTLKGSDGKEYSLKDFAGKQAVVIAWFPKAFTGG